MTNPLTTPSEVEWKSTDYIDAAADSAKPLAKVGIMAMLASIIGEVGAQNLESQVDQSVDRSVDSSTTCSKWSITKSTDWFTFS